VKQKSVGYSLNRIQANSPQGGAHEARRLSSNFTIVVPLFGHPRYFEGRSALLPYQQNVLVALEASSSLMATFAIELEQEGWRVERLHVARPNTRRSLFEELALRRALRAV
jgi:hypothetical protein